MQFLVPVDEADVGQVEIAHTAHETLVVPSLVLMTCVATARATVGDGLVAVVTAWRQVAAKAFLAERPLVPNHKLTCADFAVALGAGEARWMVAVSTESQSALWTKALAALVALGSQFVVVTAAAMDATWMVKELFSGQRLLARFADEALVMPLLAADGHGWRGRGNDCTTGLAWLSVTLCEAGIAPQLVVLGQETVGIQFCLAVVTAKALNVPLSVAVSQLLSSSRDHQPTGITLLGIVLAIALHTHHLVPILCVLFLLTVSGQGTIAANAAEMRRVP